MLKVRVRNNSLQIGKHFSVDFQRTLRIPDDGNTYPLPPGLGQFPIFRVEDYKDKVPATWREHGGVFIPMYQREALWLNFRGAYWRPNAVKIAVGKINAISGKEWDQELKDEEQDYIVCPDQPWLDGINAGDGYIRQFVAMPLGMGYTVEGRVTGREEFGGIQIIVYDPKPEIFPDEQPDYRMDHLMLCESAVMSPSCCGEMGLAAGGKMKQSVYPDEYGIETWDQANYGRVYVHIVNSMMFRDITGLEPPPTPISAKTYTEYGLPWFDLLDEGKGDVAASDILSKVKSVKEMDKEKGSAPQQDDTSVEIPENQIKKIKLDPESVIDGKW
ncbi:hypothetical protein [Thermincola ferriacetica]